jgi:trans-aconitate 2-methyltransferase
MLAGRLLLAYPAAFGKEAPVPWNPDLYHRFGPEREAPFEDLLSLVRAREGLRVLDLGCGTGRLTARLRDHLPSSTVLGLDRSAEMLERARPLRRRGLHFCRGSIESPFGRWDLVFSNAALHWVEDHPALIPRLLRLLRPGGQLAVQIPSNHDHPANRAGDQTAEEEPFRTLLRGFRRTVHVLPLADYATILHGAGGVSIQVFEKVYLHRLKDAGALLEWLSGTTLLPYLDRLPEAGRKRFLGEVCRCLSALYPGSPVLYTFRRTFLSAFLPEELS